MRPRAEGMKSLVRCAVRKGQAKTERMGDEKPLRFWNAVPPLPRVVELIVHPLRAD